MLALQHHLLVDPGGVVFAGTDVAIFWDGIHRVVRGQTPNVDFASVLGPLNWWGPAGVACATGDVTRVLPVYLFLAGVALSGLGLVLHRRADLLSKVALLLCITSLTCRVMRLEDEGAIGLHGFYRRIGTAVFVIVAAWVLRPARARSPRAALDGAILAVLLAVALYTKVSYFAACCLLLGVAGLLLPAARRAALVAGAGTLALVLVVEVLAPGHALAYWRDLLDVAGGSRRLGSMWGWQLRGMFLGRAGELVLGLALPAVWLATTGRSRVHAVLVVATVVAWFVVDKLDAGFKDWTGLLGATLGAGIAMRARRPAGAWNAFAAILMAVAIAPLVWSSHGSLLRYRAAVAEASREEQELSPLIAAPEHARYLRSGLAFLREQRLPDDARLFVLDLANPFSTLLGLDPPSGSALWIHPVLNVFRDQPPPLEELTGDSTHLLLPRKPLAPITRRFLRRTYRSALRDGYEPVASNDSWRLYRRKR